MRSRRGMEPVSVVVSMALGLLLLWAGYHFIYKGYLQPGNSASDCYNQGGWCQTQGCDTEKEEMTMSFACKGDIAQIDGHCCKYASGKPPSAEVLAARRSAWDLAQLLSTIKPPIVKVSYPTTTRGVPNPVVMLAGGEPVLLDVSSEVQSVKCPAGTQNPLCNVNNWHIRYALETSAHQVLWTSDGDPGKYSDQGMKDFITTIQPTGSSDSQPFPTSSGKPSSMPKNVQGQAGGDVKGALTLEKQTFKSTINFIPKSELAGQTLHLAITVYPGQSPDTDPAHVGKADVYFNVVPPLTVTGLSDRWTLRKDATLKCNAPLQCTNIFYTVQTLATADAAKADYPCARPTQKLGEETSFGPLTVIQYCITDAEGKQVQGTQCYTQRSDCQTEVDSRKNPQYASQIQPMLDASMKSVRNNFRIEPTSVTTFMNANALIENEGIISCRPRYMRDPSGPAGEVGTPYRARMNAESKVATINLDQDYAAGKGKYLCAWGQDAGGKLYSVGKGKPILVDITPPVAKVKFSPATLQVSFYCTDADSGCKNRWGVSYVTELTKFFPALFSGPQSASTWCPASAASYALESRPEIPYTSAEARVLCYRAEDNVGNSAVAMTQVYNAYDTVAKAIVMAMQ